MYIIFGVAHCSNRGHILDIMKVSTTDYIVERGFLVLSLQFIQNKEKKVKNFTKIYFFYQRHLTNYMLALE